MAQTRFNNHVLSNSNAIYNGSAESNGSFGITLVPNEQFTLGSAWHPNTLELSDLLSFNASFKYWTDVNGGDGLAFVIQSSQAGTSALASTGKEGSSLGYAGIKPSIIVEIDLYRNSEFNDPSDNHFGINIDGQLKSVTTISPEEDLHEFAGGYIWVDYDGEQLKVFFNPSSSGKPGSPILTHNIDVLAHFGGYYRAIADVTPGVFADKALKGNAIAYCWRIERTDGFTVGFTEHDCPLKINGTIYTPISSPLPNSTNSTFELNVDNAGVEGIVFPGLVEQEELLAGKYDRAKVEVFLCNWLSGNKLRTLHYGEIGQIEFNNRIYKAEVRGITQKLQQARVRRTVSQCPLVFGESGPNKCNKNLSGLTDSNSVTSVSSNAVFRINSGRPSGFYSEGKCTFTSGQNNGITMDIESSTGSTIFLWESAPFKIEPGDEIILTAGCAKTLEACKSYDNIENFGADPFIPGTDFYVRGGEKLAVD